ncbi:hypothetical protein L3X38_003993 [Prunus dulcis]|uniref:GAG-pre-integrase domain-containing protein n=1 Tax=Prunus dulcis TaxID=3755 RepID=A0AAD4ZN52_PRUDU|nr:hypothetical protein L3X38_003993 [Prunus dulcis]
MGDNSFVGAVAAASRNLCGSDCISSTGSNTYIIDTVASDHMTYDATFFDELSSNTRDPYITSANGLPSPITGEGTISFTSTLSLSRSQDLRDDWACVKDKQQIWLWHRRLEHPSFDYLKRLFPSLFCSCDEFSFKCETCILVKSHRIVFPLSDSKAAKCFDLVHSDVWGPARVTSNGFRWHYPPNTTPFTPQQNGVSERKNRHLIEVAWSLLLNMSVTHHLWSHGVLDATYLINRPPSRVLDFKTPLDVLCPHTSPVSVSKLPPKVFGCVAYIHVYSHN